MSPILLAALQVASPAPLEGVVRSDFDLAGIRAADGNLLTDRRTCRRDGSDDIVVCGRRPGGGDYPMEEMARLFAFRPVVAETSLGNGVIGRAFVESVPMDRGAVSNRVMIGIALPF